MLKEHEMTALLEQMSSSILILLKVHSDSPALNLRFQVSLLTFSSQGAGVHKPVRRIAAGKRSLPEDAPGNRARTPAALQGSRETPQPQPSLLAHAEFPVA